MTNAALRIKSYAGNPHVLFSLLMLACFSSLAGDVSWSQIAAGTFDWNMGSNWGGSVPTSFDTAKFVSPNGNQTITGDGVAAVLDVNNANPAKTRDFTGNLTVGSFVFRQGVMNVTGSLTVTDSSGTYSRIGTSANAPSETTIQKMVVAGAVNVPNVHALCVARGNEDNTSANGYLQLNVGGQLLLGGLSGTDVSMAGLMLGRTDGSSVAPFLNAAYVQFGGYARFNRLMAGFETGSRASVAVLGGEMYLPHGAGVRYRIGHKGYGVFQQLGGKVFAVTNTMQGLDSSFGSECFEMGGAVTKKSGSGGAVFYAAGGFFSTLRDFIVQGQPTSVETGDVPPISATVDGSGVLDLRRLVIGGNKTKGGAFVNVNGGGRLETILVTNIIAHAGPSVLSGNGGTLAFKEKGAELSQFMRLDSIDVYAGGLVTECNSGVKIGDASADVKLRSPKGYGVESIAFADTQVYYYAPYVDISGGSGSNATAVPLVDWDGTHRITNIVVTCRGEGYQEDDTLTVKLTKPNTSGLSAVNANVTLTENKPGVFVKTGLQRLVFYSQPDYDGVYEVREGLVIQSTGDIGSPRVSEIRVGGTDAEFQCASGNRYVNKEDRVNMVNTNAILTLGTEFGPGVISLPIGRASDKPYVQKFAKLQVRGTGNAIRTIKGEATGNCPVRLTFGAFDFAEGAQVLLPTNSEFCVYAPVAMSGQYLKNVTFEGKVGKKIGFVAADGQIVPKGDQGYSIFVR